MILWLGDGCNAYDFLILCDSNIRQILVNWPVISQPISDAFPVHLKMIQLSMERLHLADMVSLFIGLLPWLQFIYFGGYRGVVGGAGF